MSSSSSPSIAQSRIPRVKELYESLGYGPVFKRPTADLAESTHCWRKEYVTYDGIPGQDLKDWKSLSTRNDLEQMAAEFVRRGHGQKFWPLKGNESPRLIPEYPLDKYKIVELLRQLFWRQNVNAAHNANSSDQAQGQESVSSDCTSGNLSHSTAADRCSRLFDALEERHKPLQLTAGTLPDGRPFYYNSISDTIKLPSNRSVEPSLRHRSSLSDAHTKWGIHGGSVSRDVSERPGQHAQTIGAAKYSACSDTSEDIYTYRGSDGERGQSKKTSSKIVKLKYHKQSTKEAIADHVRAKSTHDKFKTPLAARGNAPEAARISPSAKVTVTRSKRVPERGCSPSTSRSSTTQRGLKRKQLHIDDEAEYSPKKTTKRKKFPSQKLKDSVAKTRSERDNLHRELDNKSSPIVMTGIQRGVKLPSILTGQRHCSPILLSDAMDESDETFSPPAAGDKDFSQSPDEHPSCTNRERSAGTQAAQIRDPVPCTTRTDCSSLSQNDDVRTPSAGISQPLPGGPPKMGALTGSFRVLHADPFRPMLPVPLTDVVNLAKAIEDVNPRPVSYSEPKAKETRSVSNLVTDTSIETPETQRTNSPLSTWKEVGTDKPSVPSIGHPLILDEEVKQHADTAPAVNTQEHASTSDALQYRDVQQEGRAHVSPMVAEMASDAPKQIGTVDAIQANNIPLTKHAETDKGQPELTPDPESSNPGISEPLVQGCSKLPPVIEEAETSQDLPTSNSGSPNETTVVQKFSLKNTPAACSEGDKNAHLSIAINESAPKVSPKQPSEHPHITSGHSIPVLPREPHSHPSTAPGLDIRYFIRLTYLPRPVKQRWDIQSLSGKSVEDLFQELSNFISKPDIQRIDIRIELSQSESKSSIKRNDSKAFEDMKRDFADDIRADMRNGGNMKFTVWLEPDAVQQESQFEVRDSCVGEEDAQIFV